VSLFDKALFNPLIVRVFPDIQIESSESDAISPPLYPIPYLS
jgi:hypothetical protein